MSRTACRVLLALGLSCFGVAHAAESPTAASRVIEELGCTQLQFTQDMPQQPEVVLDENLILNADKVELDKDGLSQLAGAVTLRQGETRFSAETLDYDNSTRTITVNSESLFRNRELIIKSREARFDLNAESGAFLGTEFTLPSRSARGSAESLEVASDGRAQLGGASYTTCAPGSKAWYLEASRIELDHDEGLGSARHTRLRFMGLPVLYVPYLQFPIDDRRRSGLLYPTVGSMSGSGFDMRWPVYLNLAPNYDATVTPRVLAERGVQGGLDFRYLLGRGQGQAHYEYLDDDKFGEDRSQFRFNHVGLINDRLGVEATYAETSDRSYFEDLGGTLASSSITHLEQTARLTYQAPATYRISAMVQNFQPIASNLLAVDDPYKRLPQIRFSALTPRPWMHTRAGLGSEFVNFAREDSVEGGRMMLSPYLRFERQSAAWYVQSQADLHYTRYELSSTGDTLPDTPERSLPVFSAEGGVRFERVTGSGKLQTLTPRGFALYVPFENQDALPLFDTGEPDFDFVQLFARNRFSGDDRLADAKHVAGALTLRELDPITGRANWSASIGQLYRFEAPRVGIPDFDPPDRGATEFVGQFDYRLWSNWMAVVAGQWAPEENNFERSQLALRYREPGQRRQFDLSYRYRRDLLEQADLAFLTPIGGAWKLAARTRFSLRDSQSRENLVGVEYGTCCWAIRASYRRFIGDASGDFDSGVYLQLQLKGLANIGAGGASLLPDEEIDGERPD
ncbi:MAG: LPS-assembly protein LptD [Panacagrimonas sp.]